ncbi:MAG TPA: hypothetical protein VGQ76_15040 [Thermoanaerobaculia bacterium]|jgi:uncharacterized protein (TIGR02588 family)|nr:hypothetical protein [Thermoanaerobaculia bacterium]
MKLQKNPVEWSVFVVSALLVAACVALLIAGSMRNGDKPPEIVVTTGAPVKVASGFGMPVRVRNLGDETAGQLQVEIALESEGKELESASLNVPFVPRHSEREGWVVFRQDPRCCNVVARAHAFEKP